jgi:hypothetical protein
VSDLERQHYHAIIDGDGHAVQGFHGAGVTAGHTRGLNTASYGLAVACMAGAVESGPGKTDGRYPLRKVQLERLCQAAAEVCHAYGLEVTERTVLCHSEVTHVYGILQRGKWDIDRYPEEPAWSAAQLHEVLRGKTRWSLERLAKE